MKKLVPALAVALSLGLGACSPDEPEAAPAPTSGSSATSPVEGTEDDAGDGDTEPASPAAEPFTGPVLEHGHASLRIPEGWRPDQSIKAIIFGEPTDLSDDRLVAFTEFPAGPDPSFEENVDSFVETWIYDGRPKLRGEVTIAGEPGFRMSGAMRAGQWLEYFGSTYAGQDYGLEIQFTGRDGRPGREKQREAFIERLLAGWEWK